MSATSSLTAPIEPHSTLGDPPSLQARIGGRWAISWPSYLLGSILIIILITLSGGVIGAQPVSRDDVAATFFAALIGTAVIGVTWWVAHLTVFRHRRTHPVSVPRAVGLHLTSGALFGLSLVIAGSLLGLDSELPAPIRVVALAAAALWWCLTVSMLLDGADRFSHSHRELVSDAVALELTGIREAELTTALRAIVQRERIEPSSLKQVTDELDDLAASAQTVLPVDQWWLTSQSLRRDGSPGNLREEFTPRVERLIPVPGLLAAGRELLRSGRFSLLPSLLVIIVVTAPHAIASAGPLTGALIAMIVGLTATGILALANSMLDHLSGALHAVVIVTWWALVTAGAGVFIAWPDFTWTSGGDIAAAVVVIGATLAASASLDAMSRARRAALSSFLTLAHTQRDYQRERMARIAALARVIADSVVADGFDDQAAALQACATGLDSALTSTEIDRWRHALEWGTSMISATPKAQGPTLIRALESATEPWVGFIDITIEIPEDQRYLTGDDILLAADDVSRILDETYRSTACARVTIEVSLGPTPTVTCERMDVDTYRIDLHLGYSAEGDPTVTSATSTVPPPDPAATE